MRKILSIAIMLAAGIPGFSQFEISAMAAIPDTIKKGADIVKRHEEIMFDVTDLDRAKYTVHQVYTVLNADGDHALFFHENTSKFVFLDEVEIKMYDAQGKLINKFKKKDIYKQADMSGLIDDGVHYLHELKAPSYPVTVEYKYQLNYTGTLFYPPYYVMGADEAVQSSSFTVRVPSDLDLRFKEQKIRLSPKIKQEGAYKLYKWSVSNLAPIKHEEGSVSAASYYPAILLAPNRFKMYNTIGEMTSWKEFGEWSRKLCEGLDVLPQERIAFFADLVKDALTEREKVKLVYDYLQKNFRYVSIQLGIGGWKPFPARFTDEKKYGDCKALSFYMYSVLKTLGIKSYMACINAGYNLEPADPSFPRNNFNHVILCVPQPKDSIWLECTSQTTDFDYLSNFTENRNALLITEKGGVLVSTPASDPSKNKMTFVTNIKFDATGAGISSTQLECSGTYREKLTNVLSDKRDKQKEYVVGYLGFKQPDDFNFESNQQKGAVLGLSIEKIPEFNAGSKMFLGPRINRLGAAVLPAVEGRTQDYYFHSPSQFTDTTIYHLPEGYVQDVLPKKSSIENDYVKYSTNYWYDESKREIYSVMTFCIKKNKVPAAQYAGIKKVFDEIVVDGTQKIVIKKN